jgi:hypothetical protein
MIHIVASLEKQSRNAAARLTTLFPPPSSRKSPDLPPVSPQSMQARLTKKALTSRVS